MGLNKEYGKGIFSYCCLYILHGAAVCVSGVHYLSSADLDHLGYGSTEVDVLSAEQDYLPLLYVRKHIVKIMHVLNAVSAYQGSYGHGYGCGCTGGNAGIGSLYHLCKGMSGLSVEILDNHIVGTALHDSLADFFGNC